MLRLDDCIEGVSPETVQQLLTYMYSHDSLFFISSLSHEHLEKAAVLADIWAMSRFLELCDALLHGRALPSCSLQHQPLLSSRISSKHLQKAPALASSSAMSQFPGSAMLHSRPHLSYVSELPSTSCPLSLPS